MEIKDRIYGKIKINDPLTLKIIQTELFQRLKRINQYGGVNFVFPYYQVSRFEHSIGVYHVLKTLEAPQEIQIAGLLHDVGHAAFSHMVDMAMSSKTEDYHESKTYLLKGLKQVNELLEVNGIILKNPDEYPEIKKPLPDIGADRIDYAIRDYVAATGKKTELGRRVLESVKLEGKDIIFTDINVAKKYALVGLEAQWKVIYESKVAVVYQVLIEMIRKGIEENWIEEADLFKDDKHLLNLMKKNKAHLKEKHLKIFTNPFTVEEVSKNDDYDFHHVKLKVRYFDPPVLYRWQP